MMISNKAIKFSLLSLLCASLASAKFSFRRDQLRQFDFRRRHTTVGPSNAFRPAATVDTVTVTVSTTSTTTSTATTTSISTSETTASTTITDTITPSAVPPAVVQMHTTHIAILPRATDAVSERPRMRKVRRGGLPSGRDESEDGNTLGDVSTVIPSSENIAAMKQVHRRRATDAALDSVSAIQPLVNRARVVEDVEAVPVDALSGILGVGKSTTATTSGTESNINGEVASAKDGLVSVAESDVTTTSTDVTRNDSPLPLAVANTVPSSIVGSAVNTASTGPGTGNTSATNSSTSSDSFSVGVSPIAGLEVVLP